MVNNAEGNTKKQFTALLVTGCITLSCHMVTKIVPKNTYIFKMDMFTVCNNMKCHHALHYIILLLLWVKIERNSGFSSYFMLENSKIFKDLQHKKTRPWNERLKQT